MILRHLQTFVWLRWRIGANRNRRAGLVSYLIEKFVTVLVIGAAFLALLAGFLVGLLALPRASPMAFLLVWDAVVGVFLFFWIVELLAELQQSELLSLENFLHLPVSLAGVFLINYVGSMYSVSAIFFLPAMTGLSVGLVFSKGPIMLLLFPLVGAFILMVTALTYQFRGWLASLMVNQRRRRTVIAVTSLAFMLLFQTPQIFNLVRFRQFGPTSRNAAEMRKEREEIERALAAGQITKDEYSRRAAAIARKRADPFEGVTQRGAKTVNLVLPPGWLPYGAAAASEGNALPPLLGTLGLALIGAASLRRSYRTTLRLYTGHFSSGKLRGPPRAARGAERKITRPASHSAALLERRLPGLSEHASIVALANFRALIRAPEAKMVLLSPVIMIVVFGGMFLTRPGNLNEFLRPMMAAGAMTFLLFMLVGLAGNLFGFDRAGFRAFVLSPVSRKDILLGKNLSLVPFATGLMAIAIVLIQFVHPMRADHFIALLLQMIPMYLLYCLVGNFLSIIAPMAMKSGSLAPARPKGMKILVHLAFVPMFPLALVPTLIPLGIEFLLDWANWWTWFPAYLVFTLAELAVAAYVYAQVLDWQGNILQRREQGILEIVTAKSE